MLASGAFPDPPLRGVFARNDVYAGITAWDSFEPWLSRIESFPERRLGSLVDQIPPEWYGSAVDKLGSASVPATGAALARSRLSSFVQELVPKSLPELAGAVWLSLFALPLRRLLTWLGRRSADSS